MKHLVPVPFERAAPFARVAAIEKVSVKAGAGTQWYGTHGGEGFLGVLQLAAARYRIKGVWVRPEFRGQGIGTAMTEEVIDYLKGIGAMRIEVIAMNPKFYEARGFIRGKQVRPGSLRLHWRPSP